MYECASFLIVTIFNSCLNCRAHFSIGGVCVDRCA